MTSKKQRERERAEVIERLFPTERTWVVERQWIVTAPTAQEALLKAEPDQHEHVRVYEGPPRPWEKVPVTVVCPDCHDDIPADEYPDHMTKHVLERGVRVPDQPWDYLPGSTTIVTYPPEDESPPNLDAFVRHQRLMEARSSVALDGETQVVGIPDGREPRRCPKCGEMCSYDGWGHVHPSGLGIGSCRDDDYTAEAVDRTTEES